VWSHDPARTRVPSGLKATDETRLTVVMRIRSCRPARLRETAFRVMSRIGMFIARSHGQAAKANFAAFTGRCSSSATDNAARADQRLFRAVSKFCWASFVRYARCLRANPKPFTIELACRFIAIARETRCVDDACCERLDEMRRDLEEHRQSGLTGKNIALIRQVLTPGVWNRVVKLPFEMMATARQQQAHGPARAAVTAQIAVAIAILTVAPVRLANLTAIRLGTNLIKPDGPASKYWLVFPDYDVKNRVKLEFPLEQYLTRLIDEYVHDFRPGLLRGRNEDWLFPGQGGGAKGKIFLSGQITQRIVKATGPRITVHQFRHAAGALILQRRPGEYELVRRLLGHRNVQTTINAYVGLENIQASEIFSRIVKEHLDDALEAAECRIMTDPRSSAGKHPPEYPRSLPASEWPDADRRAWEDACRSGSRLQPGGAASYLAEVSRNDYANRYGAFLGFLQRSGRLDRDAGAAAQVTLAKC
jgi:Phage integrase family